MILILRLYHQIAGKIFSPSAKKKTAMCKKYHIVLTAIEKENPFLIHAKLGAFLAKTKYGIDNEDVLHAILVHTTGAPNMNLLDKIIYIADYIEPNRDKAANWPEVRKLSFLNMDAAMKKILSDTLVYLESTGGSVDPLTAETYEYYRQMEA